VAEGYNDISPGKGAAASQGIDQGDQAREKVVIYRRFSQSAADYQHDEAVFFTIMITRLLFSCAEGPRKAKNQEICGHQRKSAVIFLPELDCNSLA